jgi:hypothetical protein
MKKLYEHIFKRHRLKQLNEAMGDDEIAIPLTSPFNNGFPWRRPTSSSPNRPNTPIPPLPTANPDDTISPANPRPGNPLGVQQDPGTLQNPNQNSPQYVWVRDEDGIWRLRILQKDRFTGWQYVYPSRTIQSMGAPYPIRDVNGGEITPLIWNPILGIFHPWKPNYESIWDFGGSPPPSELYVDPPPFVWPTPHWTRPDAPRGPRY